MTHDPNDRAGLLALAARNLLETQRALAPDERQSATVLLADLYATGLRHGITPEHWAAVASLGHETIDALRLRDCLPDLRPTQSDERGLAPSWTPPLRLDQGRER